MAEQKASIFPSSKLPNYSTRRLFESIRGGEEVVTIQTLLQVDADIDGRDRKGCTPLMLACLHHRRKIANLLIKSGANVGGKSNGNGCTVLHYASENGWTKMVQGIVKKIPNLDAKDIRGETAIHHAARIGRLKLVKCLVANGADINQKNRKGFTPLLCAAEYARKNVVDLLLKSRANIDGDERLLLYYASLNEWTDMLQYLVKRVPDVNKRYASDERILDVTWGRRHLKLVKCLMGKETDANTKEMIGQAVLFKASFMGHLAVVQWLVQKGPDMKRVLDVNGRDYYGETALHRASVSGNLEVVKCLMQEATDINVKDKTGETPLHKASRSGNVEVVKSLLVKGADVNVKNCKGDTPLLSAAKCSCKDVVDLLMYSGTNLDASPRIRRMLLRFAVSNSWLDILEFFVKTGYDLDTRNKYNMTALADAIIYEEFDVVQYLLRAGASWDVADEDGESPFNYITKDKSLSFKFFKLFIENGAYLKPVDYASLVESSSLILLRDVKLCSQAIVNKINHSDLAELYKLPTSGILPRIEDMKIASGSKVAEAIEQAVEFEIEAKGHCNVLEAKPIALSILAIQAVLKYYGTETSELENRLKRPAAFDSNNNYQPSSKLMRVS